MIENPRIKDLAVVVVRCTRQGIRNREAYEEAFEKALHSPEVHEAHLTPEEQLDLKKEAESLYRTESMEQARNTASTAGAKFGFAGRIPRRSNPGNRVSGDDWQSRAAGDKPESED